MGENSSIEWTDHTFNPWIGCTAVSAGCKFCYAEVEDKRRGWTVDGWGRGKPRRRTSPANWKKPVQWNAAAQTAGCRARVFCASLADVFDPEVPDQWRHELFHLIWKTENLDWLLLTKRPQHMRPYMSTVDTATRPNVWLGVSVEDQATADERIPLLLETPAAVRFVSYEPALGPVDFSGWLHSCDGDCSQPAHKIEPVLNWIIVGGESGPHARPFEPAWARSTIEQCKAAGVACFVKQLGSQAMCSCIGLNNIGGWAKSHGHRRAECARCGDSRPLRDRKGGDMYEWPEDLRVREFPR